MTNLPPEDLFFLGVKALIKNTEGKYLLLEADTSRFTNHDGSDYRDIPGGRLDGGEDVYTGLSREVLEEIGISDIHIQEHLGMCISPTRIPTTDGDYGLILSLYTIQLPPEAEIILSKEHISHKRCNLEETKQKLAHKYTTEFLQIIQ